MTDTFRPQSVRSFHFVGYDFEEETLTARLRYSFDTGQEFCEDIVFEGGQIPDNEAGRAALDGMLRHLHLVAGISYYKAAAPPEIVVDTEPIPRSTARFLDKLYLLGLGELAYRNNLDLRQRIRFPFDEEATPKLPASFELPRRTAVPVGGGKDSVVTIEALKNAGEPMVLISVGDYQPIRDVSEVAGIPRIVIRRRISPVLLELNQQGAINGHVPISAILAFILGAAAILYGFDAVAMSNERSADEGNLVWKGLEINHQYSKSSTFERDFHQLVENRILPGFRYFSFLRPFSELAITSAFSRAPRAYREVFRSCNTAFRLDELRRGRRWCRDCPKCRFVFLALAPFLPKEDLVRVFGGNLFEDPAQQQGFADMLGLGDHKPFECVGEIDECVAALGLVSALPDWRDDLLVRRLGDAVLPKVDDLEHLVDETLRPREVEALPERYRSMLPDVRAPRIA